ncbi:MAG: hypothetical protein ACJ71H_16145, partial [Nitrososphaeraceae archaeon]
HYDSKLNKCVPTPSCKVDCTTNPTDPSCPPLPSCEEGSSDCPPPLCQPAVIGISCPPPSPPPCPEGQHYDSKLNKCVPICPSVTELVNGKC